MQRYKYDRRLKANEIRLLEIARHPEDNKLQGRIRICNLVEQKPRYEALSYLWGPSGPEVEKFQIQIYNLVEEELLFEALACLWEPSEPRVQKAPIRRQEPVFDIFENLYTALHRILSLTDEGEYRTLWIDQICINQEDQIEQNAQLLLMREIYKRANDVLVWLGDPAPVVLNVAAYLGQIPGIIKNIGRNVTQLGPNFLPSALAGLPLDDDPVWAIIIDILHKEWYSRVWTLQEAVLGKRLVVYYGSNILDWEFIYKLYSVYGAAPRMPLLILYDEKEMGYSSIHWIQAYRICREKSKLIDFSHLLWTCGTKGCKYDVDKIYGILGMVEKDIEKGIPVDVKYKEDPRPVFLEAFKIAIQNDHQLHLLTLPFERGTKLGFPSWCPDLKRPIKCVQLMQQCGARFLAGIRSSTEKSSILAITNSNFLSIKGVEVDKVLKVAKAQIRYLQEIGIRKIPAQTEFNKETLLMAQEVYRTREPEEYCRTLIANTTRSLDGRQWSTEEMRVGYQAWLAEGPLLDYLKTTEKSLAGLYASSAIKACCGRRFITTIKGRVGLAPADCKEGDVICVLLGSGVPFVLRPNVAGAGETSTFSLVGESYLHGIMNSEVLDMLERNNTELELRDIIIT